MTDRILDNLISDYKAQLKKASELGMTKEQAENIIEIEKDSKTIALICMAISLLALFRTAHKLLEGD